MNVEIIMFIKLNSRPNMFIMPSTMNQLSIIGRNAIIPRMMLRNDTSSTMNTNRVEISSTVLKSLLRISTMSCV